MNFTGEEQFATPQRDLWHRVTDLSAMAQRLPGLEEVARSERKRLVCRVRPRFSFLSGTIRLAVEITQEEPPVSARMRVQGKGIGTSLVIETGIVLSALENATSLVWSSEVAETTGLLKAVSPGLLEATARRVMADVWQSLRDELESA
jgi:hypothetical protein